MRKFFYSLILTGTLLMQDSFAMEKDETQSLNDLYKTSNPEQFLQHLKARNPEVAWNLCQRVMLPSFYDEAASMGMGVLKRNKAINFCEAFKLERQKELPGHLKTTIEMPTEESPIARKHVGKLGASQFEEAALKIAAEEERMKLEKEEVERKRVETTHLKVAQAEAARQKAAEEEATAQREAAEKEIAMQKTAEEEADAKRKNAEEEAVKMKAAEESVKQKTAEEEAARMKAAEEEAAAKMKAAEEEAAKMKAAEEEAATKKRAAEQLEAHLKAEEEAKQQTLGAAAKMKVAGVPALETPYVFKNKVSLTLESINLGNDTTPLEEQIDLFTKAYDIIENNEIEMANEMQRLKLEESDLKYYLELNKELEVMKKEVAKVKRKYIDIYGYGIGSAGIGSISDLKLYLSQSGMKIEGFDPKGYGGQSEEAFFNALTKAISRNKLTVSDVRVKGGIKKVEEEQEELNKMIPNLRGKMKNIHEKMVAMVE